ncbi:PBSX family phage terminase large subunit [Weissella confusa]|uniref:PBSX family phage terminase large subunit n=1 Tax=Weissella confusa TaxID=1583 RepID=A0AAJ3DCL5_WEICO|nr:PBSX family phage terminase large subunit [Weissella confusa]NBA12197.1 PBSX family phage terminase large subunit [Weissella confusa]
MEINVAKMINPHFDVLMKPQQYFTYSNAVFEGGRASTKSSAISLALVLWFLADKNANVVTFRKVANTLSGSVYEQIKWAIIELGFEDRFRYMKSPLRIIDKVTGSGFYFFGVDDPMKQKSQKIAKGYVSVMWFEELAEFSSWDEVDTVRLTYTRQKLPDGKQVVTLYSYNPPRNPYDWVNTWAEERKTMDGWLVDHSTYLDDEMHFLSDQYIDEIEQTRQRDPDYYRWQFLGEAVGLGTNVYNMDMFHLIDELPSDDPLTQISYSLDTGHAQSATALSVYGFTAKGNVILLDTYYYSPAGQSHKLAPSQLSVKIHDFIASQADKPWGHLPVAKRTIDSAEAAIKNQYQLDYGITWHSVAKLKNTEMIDRVYSLLASGRFYILDTKNNQVFVEQHRNYQWDEKTLNTDNPRVLKVDDHTVDEMKYMVLDNARLIGLKI